jgi:hypothetical protein
LLKRSLQTGRHPQSVRGQDLYETPPAAVEALLRVEYLPRQIWEPAAGRGAIVNVLREHGHEVIATDVVAYDFTLDSVIDFFAIAAAPADTIVTNPPYKCASDFARHALDLAPRVYLLLRLAFLESTGRTDILERCGLRAVHIFRNRLPMMHRHGWTGRRAGSAIPYAWFCWDRSHTGPATFNRISTQPNQKGDRAMTKESTKPTPENNTATPETESAATPIAKPSAFNLDKFKSKRAAALANVETLLTALPIHKIGEAKDYVMLHFDEVNYWSHELCFVSVPIKGQKRDTLHLIDEDLAMQYLPPARIIRQRLALATKPFDVFFLCIVPTRNPDNAWNETALQACEQAKTRWTQATSRKEEGVESYKVGFSKDADAFPLPKWPTQSLSELIGVTFPGRMIESEDHPGLLRLIGAKQSMS